jgi:hypothetical protein
MSLSSATGLPTPGVAYRLVIPEFDELGAAGQRLWLYLWQATRFGKAPVRLTDCEIAQACGRGLRWAQKALHQLLHFKPADSKPEDPEIPLIDRFRQYGPRHIAGRVIQIIIPFKPPKHAANGKANDKTKPAGTTAPKPQPTANPTPAQPEPPDDPEQLRKAAAELRAMVAAAAEEDRQAKAQQKARPTGATFAEVFHPKPKPIKGLSDPLDLRMLEIKDQLGEPLTPDQRLALEQARRNRSP